MLKTNLGQQREQDIYFYFYPAVDRHRDIRLAIEMKSSQQLKLNFEEIQRAFVKYFHLFVLPTHELYLRQSGPVDKVVRFRANSCNVRTFVSFFAILTDNNVWYSMRLHEMIALQMQFYNREGLPQELSNHTMLPNLRFVQQTHNNQALLDDLLKKVRLKFWLPIQQSRYEQEPHP